jgi:EAL domain-containing protein (putative c-di-GMP-specific phosphodiesterase class I)
VDVIAERMEANDRLTELKDLKCKYGQGYRINYPLDKAKIKLLLSEMYQGEQAARLPAEFPAPAQPLIP